MSVISDLQTEVRRLATSKPVHAAAGAGVMATEALREFPARLAKWRTENDLAALQHRATGYVTEVRTRAIHNYDRLATRGAKMLDSRVAPKGKAAVESKATGTKSTGGKATSKATSK